MVKTLVIIKASLGNVQVMRILQRLVFCVEKTAQHVCLHCNLMTYDLCRDVNKKLAVELM